MSLSLSAVVWIIGLVSFLIVAIIWTLYKLYAYFRDRHDADISKSYESVDSSSGQETKKSTGFVPTISITRPAVDSLGESPVDSRVKGKRSSNFLDLLNRLNEMDDEDGNDRKHKTSTASTTSGIEANPSDETASQTFIGKELDMKTEPGRIQLYLISKERDDQKERA